MNCTGSENDVRNCPNGGWRKSDCGHNEDAGVKCHHPHAQKPPVYFLLFSIFQDMQRDCRLSE